MPVLQDTLSATGSTSARTVHSLVQPKAYAYGTWGGGTLELDVSSDDGTTWISTGETTTANGILDLNPYIAWGVQYRFTLSGGAGPYSITIDILPPA